MDRFGDPTSPLKPWQMPGAIGRVRATDPETSVEAAIKTAPKADSLRGMVFRVICLSDGLTHDELIERLPGYSPSGIRSRCAELVQAGLVIHDGYRTSAAGNRARVWRGA